MLADALDLGIDLNVWPWVWLSTAVVFALVELILVPGMFIILPWALSAFIASILAFYDVPVEVQWGVFVFGGGALFAVMYRWAQRFMRENTMDPGVGAERLVGLTAIVTSAIDPDDTDRRGRVNVDGEVWGAITDADEAFEAGAKVRVAAMKGTRVVVEPIETPVLPAEGDTT